MSTLQHHGIEGQKWGVRRFQNPDGSLTPAGVRRYRREAYKKDKLRRHTYELKARESRKIAKFYFKKLNSYTKKYEKALAQDPNKTKEKTARIENAYNKTALGTTYWAIKNMGNASRLKFQVINMIDKYSETKIKDINTKYTKNAEEIFKTIKDRMTNGNRELYRMENPWEAVLSDHNDIYRAKTAKRYITSLYRNAERRKHERT